MAKQQAARRESQQPPKMGVPELVVDGGDLVASIRQPVAETTASTVEAPAAVEAQTGGEADQLNDSFFEKAPASYPPQEIWGEELSRPPQRSRGSRFAQYTTFVMMGVFLVGIGSYMYYAQVVIPTPVEIGLPGSSLQSPFPETTASTPPPAAPDLGRATTVQPAAESATALDTAEPAAAPEPTAPPAPADEIREQEEMVAAVAAAVPAATAEPLAKPAAPTGQTSPTAFAARRRPALRPRANPVRPEPKWVADRTPAAARRPALARSGRSHESEGGKRPDRADVLRKMAYHYLNVGRHRDAEKYASQAVGADPRSSQGWILLGLARDALQDREGAKSAFQRCTQAEGPYVSECRRLKAGYM